MLGEVMSATRGATDAFSGVSRHVNGAVSRIYNFQTHFSVFFWLFLFV